MGGNSSPAGEAAGGDKIFDLIHNLQVDWHPIMGRDVYLHDRLNLFEEESANWPVSRAGLVYPILY